MKRVIVFAAAAVLLFFGRSEAAVLTLHFQNITHTSAATAEIGESQLFLEVSNVYPDEVLFTFKNVGIHESVISEIYFDDSSVLGGITSIVNNSTEVIFIEGANPPELPGANLVNPVFETTTGFLAQASSPANKRGVSPGEQVGIKFNFEDGKSYQDVIDAILNGSLRVGMHVSGFYNGDSEAFVNEVPEPATIALLGLGALVLIRKRKP